MKPSHIDPELCIRHTDGETNSAMTKHVDDLKITGEPEYVKNILSALQAVFGELKIEWYAFTNCGVRHIQCKVTFQITLDQTEYAANLRFISLAQLTGAKAEDECCDELHQLYQSLLGAVAYLTHTRVDVIVFIVALQRYASKPRVEHVKRLNKLLRWIQKNPKKLAYKNLGGERRESEATGTHVRAIAYASFKKEVDDGYGMRGAIYGRCSGQEPTSFSGEMKNMHVLDYACKSIRQVTRGTVSAELLSAGNAADEAILISHMVYEIEHGPITISEARQRRFSGGYVPVALYLDAKSVFAAVTATCVKIPAEKSLLTHVQYLREMLDHRVLRYLFWLDTRDMGADGLTKGAVIRALLHIIMGGDMPIKHACEKWESRLLVND